MSAQPSLAVLALTGLSLLGHKYDAIGNLVKEIAFIVNYVPVKYHLTEFDEIGLWQFLEDNIEKELEMYRIPNPAIVQLCEHLEAGLSEHYQLLDNCQEILSPAFIVQNAITEIFPKNIILAADEAYVGLIARYINPDIFLWTTLLSEKCIELTQQLFFAMSTLQSTLHFYMIPLQNLHRMIQSDDYDDVAYVEWEKAKAMVQLIV